MSLGRGDDQGEEVDSPALGLVHLSPGTPGSDALHGLRGGPVRLERFCLVVAANLSGMPFPPLPRENNPHPAPRGGEDGAPDQQ